MKEQTAIKLFSIMAVAFMMVCALGVIVSESEEADAASVYTITFDAPGGDGIGGEGPLCGGALPDGPNL